MSVFFEIIPLAFTVAKLLKKYSDGITVDTIVQITNKSDKSEILTILNDFKAKGLVDINRNNVYTLTDEAYKTIGEARGEETL